MKTTISIIKADIGGFPGHSTVHPELKKRVTGSIEEGKKSGILKDFHVGTCGDDIDIIMTHTNGINATEVHKLAWDAFKYGTELAKDYGLYGAGQDLIKDAFSGNVRGMGPGVAEMEITERKSEPFIAFLMDKTDPAAFNYPIYKIFGDPFNTAGLVIDPALHNGFTFEVYDIYHQKTVKMSVPEEMYDLLALIGSKSKYVIKHVYPRKNPNLPDDEPAAVISTEKLSLIAGKYVGKDDPAGIVRCQSGFPALGEVLEPFSFPYLTAGWMRGSHNGPIMPVAMEDARPSRFDGPPRVVALGFQLKNAKLHGPVDLFSDISFDKARRDALDVADYMRRHGPFEPHRLPPDDMEYTTLPKVLDKLKDRFVGIK